MNQTIPVITLDGPSGSGKGTISQLLAEKLHWHFLDSGALYRVLAYAVEIHHIDVMDVVVLSDLAKTLQVEFKFNEIGSAAAIYFEGDDISKEIRTEACGSLASQIAVHQQIRDALLQWQRDFRKAPGLVTDGRDMGTVVFPNAQVKFFLSASLEERAQRRYNQLKQGGMVVSLEEVLDELTMRDVRDKGRVAAPMKPAEDAIIIDTTGIAIKDVLLKVLTQVETKLAIKITV